MGLFFSLLYIALMLLSPAEMVPELAPYRVGVIASTMAVLCSIYTYTMAPIVSKLSLQFWLVVAFTLWLAAVWIPNRWFFGPIFVILEFTPNVIVYFLLIAHLRSPSRLHLLRLVVVGVSLYVLYMGFSQYPIAAATHTDMPYALVWGGDDEETPPRLRGLGVLGDPNIFAQYLLALFPMLFVSNRPRGMRFGYVFAVPIAILFLVAVYLTGSRGAILGVFVLIGLYLESRFKKKGLITGIILGVGGVIALNLSGMSRGITVGGGSDRLMLWSEGIGLLKTSPLWGLGYTSFADEVQMTAHNSYLLCAVEAGVIGLFFWMGIMLITIRQLRIVSNSVAAKPTPGEKAPDPVLARWAEAVKKSVIVYLFTAYFLSCTYQMFLYLLVGVAGAIFCAYSEKPEHPGPFRFLNWQRQALAFSVGILFLIWVSVHRIF